MGNKPAIPMSVENRAKQFLPFSPLSTLAVELRKREHITVERIELSDELAAELDYMITKIKKGDIISVVYYQASDEYTGEYVKITGVVSRLDYTCRLLQIVNTKISFDDIRKIE